MTELDHRTLSGTVIEGTMDLAELDPLLDCQPQEFTERLTAVIDALDRANTKLRNSPLAPTTARPAKGARDIYTGQVMALPQLDRRGEGILARRYALTKERFRKA